MDWTNFDGYPFHHGKPEVDVRREIIRSVKATTTFLVALSVAAITLATQINQATDGAGTECLPASPPLPSEPGITDNCLHMIIDVVHQHDRWLNVDALGYLASALGSCPTEWCKSCG